MTVVAMGIARAIGAAVGPPLFGALGLAGPVAIAVAADLIAAGLLFTLVRDPIDRAEVRPERE